MKKIYVLFAFIALLIPSKSLFAQLSIAPNPVYKDGVQPEDFEGVGYALVTNGFDYPLQLEWELTVIEMSEGWQAAVCDINNCYTPAVTVMGFQLAAGQEGTMDVHVYPNGLEGSAIIQVEVYQANDLTNITSATYFFNHSVGVAEKFSEAINVYPNPTQDFVTIDNYENRVAAVELYNVSGKLVLRSDLNGSDRISLQELTSGNYILKLVDENANIVSTNLIVKQ